MRHFVRLLPAAAFLLLAAQAFAQNASDDDYTRRVAEGKKAYLEQGNLRRATLELREAMRQSPGRKEAYRAMGALLVKRGGEHRARGILYLHRALQIDPNDGITLSWIGIGYFNEKKMGCAYHYLKGALANFKESEYPDAKAFEASVKNAEKLMADAEKAGGAAMDPKAVGAPERILFEYAANLYGSRAELMQGSVEAGQPIVKELLIVEGWDSEGRRIDPAAMKLEWSSTAGLTAQEGGFVAGDKPGKEAITVKDATSGKTAGVNVIIVGPAVKLIISPENVSLALKQSQPFEVRAVDAAGNTVLAPSLAWSASAEGGFGKASTEQTWDQIVTPHRNAWEVPDGTQPGNASVTVATPDGKLTVTAKLTIEKRRMDALQSRAKVVTWETTSLEEAIKKAKQQNKPLFVEITASWCPMCRKFEEGPLSEAKVGTVLKDWLAVQIDADKHPELIERYSVVDMPMVALLSPNGSIAGVFGNNMEPEGIDPRTTTEPLLRALIDGRANGVKFDEEESFRVAEAKDAAGMAAMARWYWTKLRWADAEKWARDAMKADPKLTDEMILIAVNAEISYVRHADAIKEIDAFIAANPSSPALPELTYRLGLVYLRERNDAKGKEVLQRVQKQWPTSAWARYAAQSLKK